MNKRNFKFIFAPLGVAIGITVWITLAIFVCGKLGISTLTETFNVIPYAVFLSLGIILIIIWFPFFILGIIFLGRRGAVGQSDTLRKHGIYKYIRNPMYSGISFTIFGIGLILNNTGVSIAGIIWLILAFIQCKREEKELKVRFKEEYVDYMKRTPMLVPNIKLILKDFLVKKESHK
jgi:protein-S-isoprenylcysteine O-methyltransferase Ste14